MIFYVAIVFLVLAFVVKLIALWKLADKRVDEKTRMQNYAKWSIPSYILLVPAVICIAYMFLT